MAAALEIFSGRPHSNDDETIDQRLMKSHHRYDALLQAPPSSAPTAFAAPTLKKWHRLSRNIAGAIAGFKSSFSLDPGPTSRSIIRLFPGSRIPEKLVSDIRRHLDSLPNSYSQAGFDMMDVVLHLRLVEQAADGDQPAIEIHQVSGEGSAFKLTFACKSAISLQTLSGAIGGSVLYCKKIQIFEKKGLTLGVVTVVVDPSEEKHFKSRIGAALRSAVKKQWSATAKLHLSICSCHLEGPKSADASPSSSTSEINAIRRIHLPGPFPGVSLVVSVDQSQAAPFEAEELRRWILNAGDMEFVERAGINSFIGSYKGEKVWIKKLKGRERGNENEIQIRQDLLRLMSSGMKNLLQFCGICFNDRSELCVVTPLMEGGSVRDLMQRSKKLQVGDIVRIALHMAEGLLVGRSLVRVAPISAVDSDGDASTRDRTPRFGDRNEKGNGRMVNLSLVSVRTVEEITIVGRAAGRSGVVRPLAADGENNKYLLLPASIAQSTPLWRGKSRDGDRLLLCRISSLFLLL